MWRLTCWCLGVLAYTHVGYPAIIGLLARVRPKRTRRDQTYEPRVSVLVPAHNGAKYIDEKLTSLVQQDYPHAKTEIVVYSDGSTDATVEIAEVFATCDERISVIDDPVCSGKPTALNRMAEVATGEILVITDVRQPLVPGAVRALVERLADPDVGCVTGNLVLRGQAGSGFYWRYENWIRRQESQFRSMVGMTGPLAAVRREDFSPLPHDLVLDDVWIPMQLRLKGQSVILCEDAIAYDEAFADNREFDRKTRTLAGNYQVFARMPELLMPWRNPSWFETMSHKVMRLVSPWALAGLLVSTASTLRPGAGDGMRTWVGRTLFAGQALFYLAALAGPRVAPPLGIARTFVMMHAAAIVGLWRFATGKQKVTWQLPKSKTTPAPKAAGVAA